MYIEARIQIEATDEFHVRCSLCQDLAEPWDLSAFVIHPDKTCYVAWCWPCTRRVLRLALAQAAMNIEKADNS